MVTEENWGGYIGEMMKFVDDGRNEGQKLKMGTNNGDNNGQ